MGSLSIVPQSLGGVSSSCPVWPSSWVDRGRYHAHILRGAAKQDANREEVVMETQIDLMDDHG